jgi:uncharacterized protein YidB (DUF937 family)
MSLLNSLVGAAAQMAASSLQSGRGGGVQGGLDPLAVVGELLKQGGGISGLQQRMQASGLGEVAKSWIGTGANLPVSAAQIEQAIGPELLNSVLQQLGGATPRGGNGAVGQLLAQALPVIIDQLTPQGRVPQTNGLGDLGALAQLAGQLLSKR